MIIVGALHLGGLSGRLHAWSYRIFRQHLGWLAAEYRVIGFLVEALARAELAGGFPEEILFIWKGSQRSHFQYQKNLLTYTYVHRLECISW